MAIEEIDEYDKAALVKLLGGEIAYELRWKFEGLDDSMFLASTRNHHIFATEFIEVGKFKIRKINSYFCKEPTSTYEIEYEVEEIEDERV